MSCESVRDNSGFRFVLNGVQPQFGLPVKGDPVLHVLPLFVLALAALTVGKLDQLADLMENWLSKL